VPDPARNAKIVKGEHHEVGPFPPFQRSEMLCAAERMRPVDRRHPDQFQRAERPDTGDDLGETPQKLQLADDIR
jgi:hypothetical protein